MRSWASSIKPEWRQPVYSALQETLVAPSSDVCLKLTVVHTLRTFVDSYEFDENQFLPFLQPLLVQIPALMNELTADDSFVRSLAESLKPPPLLSVVHLIRWFLVSSSVKKQHVWVLPKDTTFREVAQIHAEFHMWL